MPHFVVEFSEGIEGQVRIEDLMDGVADAAGSSGILSPDDVKVRAIPFQHYRLRSPGETFVHVTVSMLAGRTDEQKERLSILLRSHLDALLPSVTSLSIDIRDMNPIAYKKRLLPTSDEQSP